MSEYVGTEKQRAHSEAHLASFSQGTVDTPIGSGRMSPSRSSSSGFAWRRRGTGIPGAFGISRQTFEEIDTLIRSLRTGSREFSSAMDLAAQTLAMTSQGIVQKYYRGGRVRPIDARRNRSTWNTPIRRVTGRTYEGWRVRRIAPGIWELFNEERGAYMVEYGIVRGGHGVARKPLKRSAVATLRFIQRTRFGQRIMQETFGDLRNNRGHFRSFNSRLRGSNIMGIAGPTGYLP